MWRFLRQKSIKCLTWYLSIVGTCLVLREKAEVVSQGLLLMGLGVQNGLKVLENPRTGMKGLGTERQR